MPFHVQKKGEKKMRHCDKCNVDIADKIDHCPLCGRNIVGGDEQTVQQFECFPDNKIWQSKRSTILNAIFLILLIGTIVATAVDLIVNKKITYCPFVWTGALLVLIDVILPAKESFSFSSVSTICALSICAYILFLEFFTHTFGWGLQYAIPFFLLAMTLYSTTIIVVRQYYKGFDFIIPLVIFVILSIANFLVNYFCGFVYWPALVSFLSSTSIFLFILIFRFKKVREQFKKSFFV